MSFLRRLLPVLVIAALIGRAGATETENIGLRILPADKPPAVDGTLTGWNLAGGVFACADVENQRTQYATWIHAMYDAERLYVLSHWIDPTPMNNPGQVEGDYGWVGDCLQFRLIAGAGADIDQGRASHWTCWRGRDGKHVVDIAYGRKFDQGTVKDAQKKGATQAFRADDDGKGYVQVLSIPWSLIGPEGWKPAAGESIRFTVEPNFSVGANGRLTVKDIFVPDTTIDRVFTFMGAQFWGIATLEKPGTFTLGPVRLSDRREFKTALNGTTATVDWTGLIKQTELAGHKPIAFEMPFDGYISLNLFAADGTVARQLLNSAFYTKGKHEVKWDGLSTFSWRIPGDPVPAGTYTWQALVHPGLDLRLVGWAANAGSAPWDGPSGKDNWGGDHGDPNSVATLGDRVFLGWTFAEAGKALVACDLDGKVQWRNSRQGMSGCEQVAADGQYVFGCCQSVLYRLSLDGSYAVWPGRDTPDLHAHDVLDEAQRKQIANEFTAISAKGGTLFAAVAKSDVVLAIDPASGKLKQVLAVKAPRALCAIDGRACYVACADGTIIRADVEGPAKPFATLNDVAGLALDAEGTCYASVGGEVNQVVVLGKDGKEQRRIGRQGGRPLIGPWDPTGLYHPVGLAVDTKGVLWVAENDGTPKRFSAWNAKTGAFQREYLGPSTYGALGGAICPADPYVMVGQGCEWRIDPETGRSKVLAVITRRGMQNSRFATGTNGRTYLCVASNWAYNMGPIEIFERIGDAQWKRRGEIFFANEAGEDVGLVDPHTAHSAVKTVLWADANDDGKRDAGELTAVGGTWAFSGWYMQITQDLTLYCGNRQYLCTGFTACGAPTWDLAKPVEMPTWGLGSADGRLVLQFGDYAASHTRFKCFDIATGKQLWWYPDNFVGVHGSHNAPPPVQGMIRGSFGACGSARLPDPIGNVWVIPTNVGEWHLLTEKGFYLSRLFEGDIVKMSFPEKAVPGAMLNSAPCGMGGEDFGGSICLAKDGKLYIQAGKTGFWNVLVDHLDQVKALAGGSIVLSDADVVTAQRFKEQVLQEVAGVQRLAAKKATPAFTGSIEQDFANQKIVAYDKGEGTGARSALAWDDANLYAAWAVQDRTPWVNGGKSDDSLYWSGDTVDLQLGTDPAAERGRGEAVKGDVRISIGNLQGKDVAVAFRKVADHQAPRTFSSGIVKQYTMDSVVALEHARVVVTKRGEGYVVEAAIPLADLGLAIKPGLAITGDLGVTFGGQSGDRTRLRSYWSNQGTGIVDDVVFELQMEPKNWGEIVFSE